MLIIYPVELYPKGEMDFKRESGYQEIRRQSTRGSGYQEKRRLKLFNLIPGYPDIYNLIT